MRNEQVEHRGSKVFKSTEKEAALTRRLRGGERSSLHSDEFIEKNRGNDSLRHEV